MLSLHVATISVQARCFNRRCQLQNSFVSNEDLCLTLVESQVQPESGTYVQPESGTDLPNYHK